MSKRPVSSLAATRSGARGCNQLGQAIGTKGAQTRRKLLAATEALLNFTPLRDLRAAQIVRVAGTSAATFYVYFNDVSEAVLALLGEYTQSTPKLLALVSKPWVGEGAFDHAHEFAAAYVEHWQQHQAVFRLRNLASDQGDPRFLEIRSHALAPLLNAMSIRAAERHSGLPSDLHPQSAVSALLAMIERVAAVYLPGNLGITRPRLLHVAAFFAALLLGEGWELHCLARSTQRLGAQTSSRPAGLDGEPDVNPASTVAAFNLRGQVIGPKGARTRQILIDAACSLLKTRSYLDLSVANICTHAGVPSSRFYLYFKSVPEIVLVAVGDLTLIPADMMQLLSSDGRGGRARQNAYEFVRRFVERWNAHKELYLARNLASDEGDEGFQRLRSDSVRPLMQLLLERIAHCQSRGRLPADIHPASAAGAILAMIERIAAAPGMLAGVVTRESITHAAGYFLAVLLDGVATSRGHTVIDFAQAQA